MKKLLIFSLILINLIFSSKADDIRDFQIEGMSVGDSLLKYMNINEIKKAERNKNNYPNSNYVVIFYNNNSEIYDKVEIVYNSTDKSYIIEALTGSVEDSNNYQNCKIKKKEISEEFKITFKDSKIYEDESEHVFSPGSLTVVTDFYPKSGGFARVSCNDWSKEAEKKNKWVDNLKVSLGSNEFLLFLQKQ